MVVNLWIMQVIYCIVGCADDQLGSLPQETIERLELVKVQEPSGICFHSIRKTLFVVDDSGGVFEFKTDGRIVQQKQVRSADFEGITYDPATGLLYIAIEGVDSILEIDPETLEPKREFVIPRTFQGETVMKKGGQGIEGIAFAPNSKHPDGGTFFVANQSLNLKKKPKDISAVFEVEVPLKAETTNPGDVRILGYFKPNVIDISGLHFDAQRNILYAISDSTDRMMAFTRTGNLLRSWDLPGEHQEGVTMDHDGAIFIAQDSGDVLKLKIDLESIDTPHAMREE